DGARLPAGRFPAERPCGPDPAGHRAAGAAGEPDQRAAGTGREEAAAEVGMSSAERSCGARPQRAAGGGGGHCRWWATSRRTIGATRAPSVSRADVISATVVIPAVKASAAALVTA